MGHGNRFTGKKPAPVLPSKGKVVAAVSDADRALSNQHTAAEFLRKHIGGQWKYNPELRQFEAYVGSEFAKFVQRYLHEQAGATCTLSDAPGNASQTIIRIAADQYVKIDACSALRGEPKPLNTQFNDLQAMSRTWRRG